MRLALLLLAAPLAACYPPTYQVQRTARVPHATTPMHAGQPLGGPVGVTAGASSVSSTRKGNRGDAVEVTEQQVRGELRVRLRDRAELSMIHERGIGQTARSLDATQARVDEGDPHGTGMAVRYSPELGNGWSLGLQLEILRWSIPYVEYRTCVENCSGTGTTYMESGRTSVASLGLGFAPSYREGRWTVFGGAFARNHPTIERKDQELTDAATDDVESGPMNLLLHAGAALQVSRDVAATLIVNQDVTRDPVRYGPTVGLAITATLRD